MPDVLSPIAILFILLPGTLLAYLPVKQSIRMRPGKLAAIVVPLIAVLCLIGGILSYCFAINTICILFAAATLISAVYICSLDLSRWKSVSITLAVWGVFACLGSITRAVDAIICPGNSNPWFSLDAALSYNLMCWVFVALAWHPATHAARYLIEDEAFAQTWYVFWILPLVLIGVNLFMVPLDPEILYQGRILLCYIVVVLVLLLMMLAFYALFYLMATSLNKNNHLRQENQFLAMQQAQYDNLCTAISETRQARHDMRHHFSALSSLAQRGEWKKIEDYLAELMEWIPNTDLNLCDNLAVDSVVSHYGILYRKNQIPFSFQLDLPQTLPVPEIDLCLVLSNLLENALEASLRSGDADHMIRVQAYLHSSHVVLLSVENAFTGTVNEKDGVFQSSKRRGDGVGLQSVRHIAEKNGGYSRFTYADGIFRADVLLRSTQR